MVRSEASFIDGKHSAFHLLSIRVLSFLTEEHTELVHKTRRRARDTVSICMRRDCARVRNERVEYRPIADITRVPLERQIDPTECFHQTTLMHLTYKPAARHVLYE